MTVIEEDNNQTARAYGLKTLPASPAVPKDPKILELNVADSPNALRYLLASPGRRPPSGTSSHHSTVVHTT